jgi:hypothetical protein
MAKRRFEVGDLIVDYKGNVGIVLGPADSRTVTVYLFKRGLRELHDTRLRLLNKRSGGRMLAGAKV